MVDTDLPRAGKRKKRDGENRQAELALIRAAVIARGEQPIDETEDDTEEIVDDTLNKANSITVSKTTLGGYKSALKLYFIIEVIELECTFIPP